MDTKDQVIDQVEASIEQTKAHLRAQEMLLKELTKEPPMPFVATSIGKGMNWLIATVTKPFAHLHHTAEVAYADPISYNICKELESAERVLADTREIPDRNHKSAKKYAVKAMQTKMSLAQYESNDLFQKRIFDLQTELSFEASRLRPEDTNAVQAQQDAKVIIEQLSNQLRGINEPDIA